MKSCIQDVSIQMMRESANEFTAAQIHEKSLSKAQIWDSSNLDDSKGSASE